MNQREASIVMALLTHLDGSQPLDVGDFLGDLETLADAAGVALCGALPLDYDAIADVLGEIAERWDADAEYDAADEDEDADEYLPIDDDPDWRAVETAPVGDVL